METSFAVDEVANCTNAIITYIINGIASKLPLKERDMSAAINIKGKLFNMAFQQAKIALQEVIFAYRFNIFFMNYKCFSPQTYGIILSDVPDSKTGKAFVCYNEDSARSALLYDEDQQRQLTLLFVILSYLFMRGSTVQNNNTSEGKHEKLACLYS